MRKTIIISFLSLACSCSFLWPQSPIVERNPLLTRPDTLSYSIERAMFLYMAAQQLEAPEMDFTANAGVPFYFHSTKWLITDSLWLYVNDTPTVKLLPMRKIYCEGFWYFDNSGPERGKDYSKDFVDFGIHSRFRMRLEKISADSLYLKMSWIEQ